MAKIARKKTPRLDYIRELDELIYCARMGYYGQTKVLRRRMITAFDKEKANGRGTTDI